MSEQAQGAPRLYIFADDLIWATRLAGQGRTLGAQVTTLKGVTELRDLVARGAIGARDLIAIDTTTRTDEPIALVREAAVAGRVLALVQHDDPALRAAALEAGRCALRRTAPSLSADMRSSQSCSTCHSPPWGAWRRRAQVEVQPDE